MKDLLLVVIAILAVTGNAFAEIHEIPTDLSTYFLPHAAEERNDVDCPPKGYTFLPHECSCTKYYSCENGNKYVGKCPEGTIYDYFNKVCNLPNVAVCRNQMYTNDTYLSENCHFPSDCPLNEHIRLPHENDCRLFYDCTKGRKCRLSCFEGYVFNPIISACDLPKNVPDCHDHTSPTNTAGPLPTTPPTTWVPSDCPKGKLKPHECNCDAYYVCQNGQYQWMKCPTGSQFDFIMLECVSKSSAQCYRPESNECQGTCSSNSYRLPHKECNKYCTCDHGTTTVQTCQLHMYYDRTRQICNWPENIYNLPKQCDPTDCSFGIKNVPHECRCNKYYKCLSNGKFIMTCDSGKLFDYEEEICLDSKRAHCYKDTEQELPHRL